MAREQPARERSRALLKKGGGDRNIAIFGIDHKLHDPRCSLAFPQQQRAFLHHLTVVSLKLLAQGASRVAVLEEAKHGQESTVQRYCEERGVFYTNIEMPPEERQRLGIPPHYTITAEGEPRHLLFDQFNSIREQYMVDAVVEAFRAEQLRAAAVIVGAEHVRAIAARLQDVGIVVVERTDCRSLPDLKMVSPPPHDANE